MASQFLYIVTLLGVVAIGLVVYLINPYQGRKHARPPLPPGPKGIPFLGNVNDMPPPGMLECDHWLKHKDLYGPISSLTLLGQTFIIINDAEIAFELLRDRSAIHSSRPQQVFNGELVGWRHSTAMMPYNDTWRIHRKNVTKVASSNKSIAMFDRVQEAESVHFLLNMLDSPEKLLDHVRKEAGSVILKITYGYTTVARGGDPLVDAAEKAMRQFSEASGTGSWMVDLIPQLKYVPEWMPGAGFKKTARKYAALSRQCTDQPYGFVKQQMREKRHSTSVLSQCIEGIGADPVNEFVHKWSALSLFMAGSDTTVSSLMTFFLAMTVYPDIQIKALKEIEQVIGSNRLPLAADRDKLPYITAIMKETHRWHLVLPMCLPHCSIEEDICRGYRIPKGAILLPNSYHFTHDPAVYPDPMVFRPERHLQTATHDAEPDPRKFVFGYGRRICPGRYVADNALFITIAQTLAVYDINKAKDGNGNTIEPEVKFIPGAISHPVPFQCSIKPKSKAHEDLIRAAEKEYPREASDAKELEGIKW